MSARLRLVVLPHGEGLPLPSYQTAGAAGMDLASAVDLLLEPGARASIPTGLLVAIPEGHEGQIRPRSGLALRHGVTVLNAPGTIDSDYRGELCVLLVNLGAEPFAVTRGMRVAQLVLAQVARLPLLVSSELDETGRGVAGFGSTGA